MSEGKLFSPMLTTEEGKRLSELILGKPITQQLQEAFNPEMVSSAIVTEVDHETKTITVKSE